MAGVYNASDVESDCSDPRNDTTETNNALYSYNCNYSDFPNVDYFECEPIDQQNYDIGNYYY